MNVENFRLLIDTLKVSDAYDQSMFSHDCGTPACIAGHAAALAGFDMYHEDENHFVDINDGECYLDGVRYDVEEVAAEWLEIDHPDDIQGMFYSRCYPTTTKEEAIAMLEKYIETEEVDWGAIYTGTSLEKENENE